MLSQAEQTAMIDKILCGSCTPAADLLSAVAAGKVDSGLALRCYNERLAERNRVIALDRAASLESSTCYSRDI